MFGRPLENVWEAIYEEIYYRVIALTDRQFRQKILATYDNIYSGIMALSDDHLRQELLESKLGHQDFRDLVEKLNENNQPIPLPPIQDRIRNLKAVFIPNEKNINHNFFNLVLIRSEESLPFDLPDPSSDGGIACFSEFDYDKTVRFGSPSTKSVPIFQREKKY